MSVQESNLKAIADAIREKDGTTELIPANAFADRILTLPVGAQNPSVELPKVSNHEEQLARIAAAIRAKEGSAENIPASEFAERILALKKTQPSRLPEGYTEVEYIHVSGAVGFNTNYFADPTTTQISIDVKLEPYSGKSEYFFRERGRYANSSNFSYYGLWRYSETEFRMNPGKASGYDSFKNVVSESTLKNRITIDVNGPNRKISIGNFSSTFSIGSHKNNGSYLFIGGNTSSLISFPGDLYSCKVYVSGTLKFDFVPCKNDSGVSGLFDLVANKFYSNSFDGIVTAGPAV